MPLGCFRDSGLRHQPTPCHVCRRVGRHRHRLRCRRWWTDQVCCRNAQLDMRRALQTPLGNATRVGTEEHRGQGVRGPRSTNLVHRGCTPQHRPWRTSRGDTGRRLRWWSRSHTQSPRRRDPCSCPVSGQAARRTTPQGTGRCSWGLSARWSLQSVQCYTRCIPLHHQYCRCPSHTGPPSRWWTLVGKRTLGHTRRCTVRL